MSEMAKRALRNTALLIALRIANPLISMVLIGLMSRRLGPEGVGAYNLLLGFFFIVHDVTTLGLNPLVTREVSRSPNQALSYLCSAVLLGGAVSLLGAGGLVSAIHFADYGEDNSPWENGPFDVIEALKCWDVRHREAFLAWARDPWWPQ